MILICRSCFEEAETTMDVDVVVCGGLAGMSAAAATASKGFKVVVVEKNGFLGGNSLISDQYRGLSQNKR